MNKNVLLLKNITKEKAGSKVLDQFYVEIPVSYTHLRRQNPPQRHKSCAQAADPPGCVPTGKRSDSLGKKDWLR